MATYSKPVTLPRWATDGGTTVAPTSGQQDTGWLLSQVPPAKMQNWLENLDYEWLAWVDERWSDGATDDDLDFNLTGLVTWNNTGGHRMDGGLDVGFVSGTPVADQVRIGDVNFLLDFDTGLSPRITFETMGGGASINYNRTSNIYSHTILGTVELRVNVFGVQVGKGLYVGANGTDPSDNDIIAEGGINCGGVADPGVGDGIFTSGITVGIDTVPVVGCITLGDSEFYLLWSGSDPFINLDVDDHISFDRSLNTFGTLQTTINSVVETRTHSSGFAIEHGLYVGNAGGATWDKDIKVEGGINCGGAVNPGIGDGIFTNAVNIGFDTLPTAATPAVRVGDAAFTMDFNSGAPQLVFDTATETDRFEYNRGANILSLEIGASSQGEFQWTPSSFIIGTASSNDMYMQMHQSSGAPATPSNGVRIYVLDDAGTARLYAKTDDGTQHALTP